MDINNFEMCVFEFKHSFNVYHIGNFIFKERQHING